MMMTMTMANALWCAIAPRAGGCSSDDGGSILRVAEVEAKAAEAAAVGPLSPDENACSLPES